MYVQNAFFLLRRRLLNTNHYWRLYVLNNKTFIPINQPKGTFWADPFPIQFNQKTYVFFEELNFTTQRGEIAYLELDNHMHVVQKTTVLKNETHFSFPNVFKKEDQYYMLPENVQSNALTVYKAFDFPNDWRPYKVLINNIKLLDPVWIFHNGLYWIMGNKIHDFEYENNNALYVYYADDLFSENWTEHPMNPVVTDAQFARNAGKIIQKENRLIRVSQNCANSYGANVNFMEIIELSTQTYVELPIEFKQGPLGSKGMHTYNTLGENVWVDILYNETI
jgi:hypothetical protein